jgi:ribonuclease Z
MRVTVLGSGSPTPVRRAQATSGYLVELGNGDNFIFDMGPGTPANLYSMGVHPALLDKLFIAHLHLDHTGGIFSLFDAMGWARNTPLLDQWAIALSGRVSLLPIPLIVK